MKDTKKILVILSGSVAVVKSKKIIDLLKKDHEVKVVASDTVINNFKGIKDIELLKENPDLSSFPLHIELAKWADLILVAPASANTISKFNAGIADNFILSILLAARQSVIFVPAMNTFMYKALVERNIISSLENLGHLFIGPAVGQLAEGECGLGRMVEPIDISNKVNSYLNPKDKTILIPYGASKVHIDNVRYITNHSTGTTGRLLINALKLEGYKVIGVDISKVSNKEFLEIAKDTNYDIYISPAAFADYLVDKVDGKIKKNEVSSITLKDNIDIISTLKELKPNKKYISFKLDDDKQRAIDKLSKFKLDLIIWNKINSFGNTNITGSIISKDKQEDFKDITKNELITKIVKSIKNI